MALLEELEKQGVWLFRYRGTLPLVVLLIGAILIVHTELNPAAYFMKNNIYDIHYESFCLLLSLAGLGIRIYTVGYTPENTSGRNVHGQVADTLNTEGIYSVVRHPLYLGNFFMWIGPAMLTRDFWFITAFCLFYWIYYERIMFAEEQFLRRKFGEVYTNWASGVNAFIPNFRNFKRPELPFSWKKVLKKEKNGFAAVFIIFFFFDAAGELISGMRDYNDFLFAACVFSLLLYLVLKFLKKRTDLLSEKGR